MSTDPPATDPAAAILDRVEEVVRGKRPVIERCLAAALAGGHALLEDVPGVGKTTLARSLAGALGGTFRRIQFTADLLPGDVLGVTVLDRETGDFRFRPGPIFANVVLADELNRATPRTQSALLEAMQEGQVTVDGQAHPLPSPFLVIATQNPLELAGTFPLPDSQLDRFLLRLSMGYPDREAERAVLRARGFRGAQVSPALDAAGLAALWDEVDEVTFHPSLEDWLLELVDRTRVDPRLARGVSTRGAEALDRTARALARVRGRRFVIPEDLRELAEPALAHRVLARDAGSGADARAIRAILAELPPPS